MSRLKLPNPVAHRRLINPTGEVYVQSFPAAGGKKRVTTGGGIGPPSRRDGGHVLLCAGRETDGGEVKSGVSFEAGAPLALFEFRSGSVVPSVPDTVTADGQRVLLNTLVDESGGAPLTVEIN